MNQLAIEFPAAAHRKVRTRKSVECTEAEESRTPGWTECAHEYLRRFLQTHHDAFLGEQYIWWSTHEGLAAPADKRAFGAVLRDAARRGVIRKTGKYSTATKNCSAKPVWVGV